MVSANKWKRVWGASCSIRARSCLKTWTIIWANTRKRTDMPTSGSSFKADALKTKALSVWRTALRLDRRVEVRPDMRITGQQNLLFVDLTEEQYARIESILREHGVETDLARLGVSRYSMACPAAPTCGLAVAEGERALPALLERIEAELHALDLRGERLSVRMTGCPNGCARPYRGDIGLVGRSAGLYDVFLGGDWENTHLNAHFASGVRYENIPDFLRPLLAKWKADRLAGEAFGNFAHRVGLDALHAAAQAAVGA